MKKLIAMIGAVAMSFGLFAASPASFTISFEEAEQDKGVNTTSMLFTPVVSDTEWAWTTEEALPLKAYGTETKFAYGTGAYARRDGFDTAGDNNNYLPLSTGSDELTRAVGEGNIYLDQLVKFTGFEDPQTNLVAGTKIAVWMSEFENDDESTETNLYVTVGKIDGEGNVEQVALKVDGGPYSLDTWYRLSIKSLGNVFTSDQVAPHAGFLIYVNGQQVGSSDADAKLLVAADDQMNGIAKGYMAKGQLFTSIAADATFTSVGYQGIGAVDDIILDSVGPAFCQAIDVQIKFPVDAEGNPSVEVDYIDVGGVRMNYPCAVPDGTEITVYFKPAPGKKITGGVTSVTKTISTGDATINVEGIVAEDVVAKKNGTVDLAASELANALAALNEGDEIATVKSCGITEGEGEAQTTLCTFTPNTTITRTATGLSIYVGNYEDGESSAPGVLEFYTGVAAGSTLTVALENPVDGMFMFAGNVAGTLTAAVLDASAGVTLSGAGKVITQVSDLKSILDGDSNAVTPTAGVPEEGWYTYALSDVPPEKIEYVTFSVTYDTEKVENVTVKTNGADVVDASGVYTVESNAMVTVAATAKTGYQNVTIAVDNVTVDAGVFKADKASSVITITAEEIPLLTYDITFATVENGTLETSVTNGIATGTTVTVIATPATGYECTKITTNGTAITGTSFEMPVGDVEIGATFTLQQFKVAAISVENASVVATNTVTDTGLDLPATVDYNTEIAVTVTPNENYEYKTTPAGWTKNEDGSITTNATVTAYLAITVEAPTAAITPVEPETPKNYDSKEAADAAAAAINADRMAMIKTPEGAVAKDYTELFTAVVKANNAVVVELNEGGTNALKAAAATIKTAVANKLGDIAAAAAGGNVEVVVTGVEPGFWYGVAATADLTTMGASQPGEWKQATTEGVTLKVTKPATGNAAFFQTRVKVK